jgi:hypothetical protein
MPELSISDQSPHTFGTAAAVPVLGLLAAADAYPVISEFAFLMGGNTDREVTIGLAVSSSLGTYDTLVPNFLVGNNARGDAVDPTYGGVVLVKDWKDYPTAPTQYLRRFSINGSGGGIRVNGLITFHRGLKLNPSTALIVWLIPGVAGSVFGDEPQEFTYHFALDG